MLQLGTAAFNYYHPIYDHWSLVNIRDSPESHLPLFYPVTDEETQETGHQDSQTQSEDSEAGQLHPRDLVPQL